MSDIHALSGAYAVDALDDAERTQFERHLAVCPECRAEVGSFRETSALLAEAQAQTPPPSLRDKVLADISAVRPFPPQAPATEASPAHLAPVVPLRRRILTSLVAAAAVVLLALGAFTWHPWQHDHVSVADQIRQAPDAVSVTEPVPGGGKLTLIRSASLERAVLIGSGVPEPAAGTTYQMWLQQPGQDMVSAGLMPDPGEPTVLTGDAATAVAAAVSVEPEAGSAHPTTHPIAVFPLKAPSGGDDAA